MIFKNNNSKLTKFSKYHLLSVIAISIVSIAILLPIVEAIPAPGHETVTRTLPSATNDISFRDTSNTANTSSAISVDTSTVTAGFITVTIGDADADYDTAGFDVVLLSATSTTSGSVETTVVGNETGKNTGTFSGTIPISLASQPGKLQIGLGDEITVLYDSEPPAVGRFFAHIGSLIGSDDVVIKDSNFRNTPSIDSLGETCPYDLFTHTVDVSFGGITIDPDTMTVTMSYANTLLGNNTVVDTDSFNDLEVVYRPTETAGFISLTTDLGGHNSVAKTITSQLPPNVRTFAPGPTIIESNGNGQYALGIERGFCEGGGGGGLVRPGLVVNALAGSGSVVRLFTGGSGGGANPTFGDASLLVLENVSDGFGGTISEGDNISLDSTKVVQTGDTAVMRFELYENQGITNLERFKMFLNFEGENYDASTIDTHVTYMRGGEITIVDPHEKIEKAEIEILQVDPWNLIVNVKIIFKNTFNTSILVDSWDLDRNSGKKLFPDALEVVEPSILLSDRIIDLDEPTVSLVSEETIMNKELTEIPVWIKSNALWWKQKQIDDSDFVAGIKYLIEKTLIDIDENDLPTSTTSKQIPVWISDVAGMWAHDSITDDEFINAMQWLISNGILEVKQ